MAIVLATQPTADGLYSGYLPVKFTAKEIVNVPAYLDFDLKTSAGFSITGVPTYRATSIGGEYFFDASNYLKSILDVRSSQGLSTTAIEELTDSYGKFEVVVSDPINGLTSLTSNEFYAFANIDGLRYLNDETANDGINRKEMLYSSDLGSQASNPNFAPKIQGEYDRVVIFASSPTLTVETYTEDKPNNGSTIYQVGTLSVSSYVNKLISVPLNMTYVKANFTIPPTFTALGRFSSFRIRYGTNVMYYHKHSACNYKEFIFVNRYGVKENIKFKSYEFERLSTKGEQFTVGGYSATGQTNYFNTSADTELINQETIERYKIKGQTFLTSHKEVLKDFVSSPKQYIVINGELRSILVDGGTFSLVEKNRGIEFGFNYRMAQKKLSFR